MFHAYVRLISEYLNHQDQNLLSLQRRVVISTLLYILEAKKRDVSVDIVTKEELEHMDFDYQNGKQIYIFFNNKTDSGFQPAFF